MSHLDTQFDTQDDTGYADRLEAGFLEFSPMGYEEDLLPVQWENMNPFECEMLGGDGDCGCSVCPFLRESYTWQN